MDTTVECGTTIHIDGYTFPTTQPGLLSYSMKTCPDVQANIPLASIFCTHEGVYDLTSIRISTCDESIGSITNQSFTDDSLEKLQIVTVNESSLSEQNIKAIAQFMLTVSNLGIKFTEKQVGEAVEIASHLTEYFRKSEASAYAREKQDLVQSLPKILRKLNNTAETTLTKLSRNINVEVRDITTRAESNGTTPNHSFAATFYANSSSTETLTPISINIPAKAIGQATNLSTVRMVSIGFRSSSLFPSTEQTEWVIYSSLGDTEKSLEINSLEEPVQITNDMTVEKTIPRLECAFWDFKISDWSREGCILNGTSPATCQCDHLTNFAILVTRNSVACKNERVIIESYTFPATQPGLLSYSIETCQASSTNTSRSSADDRNSSMSNHTTDAPTISVGPNIPRASISCTNEGFYDLTSVTNATCGESIKFITAQNFTDDSLEKLQIATANASSLSEQNVKDVTQFITDVSNLIITFNEKQVGDATEITSHLTEYYRESEVSDYAKEKQDLVQSLSKISRKLNDSAETPLIKLSRDVNVEVRDITTDSESTHDYTFNATFYENSSYLDTFIPISILIPAKVIGQAKKSLTSTLRIVSVGFRSSSLFPSTEQAD